VLELRVRDEIEKGAFVYLGLFVDYSLISLEKLIVEILHCVLSSNFWTRWSNEYQYLLDSLSFTNIMLFFKMLNLYVCLYA
jgi:hypothetical protein